MSITGWCSDVCSSDLVQEMARRAVVDGLRHLRRYLSRQIGPDAGEQRRRDDRSGLKDVRTGRRVELIGRDGAPIDRTVEETCVAILCRGRRRPAQTLLADETTCGVASE